MAQDVIVETRKLTKIYRDFWGRQKIFSPTIETLAESTALTVRVSSRQEQTPNCSWLGRGVKSWG